MSVVSPQVPFPAAEPRVGRRFDAAEPSGGVQVAPKPSANVKARLTRRPVAGRGRMTAQGYQPENFDYLDVLTEVVDDEVVGRDPMAIPPPKLKAAGHGPRETRSIVAAMGDVGLVDGLKEYGDLRRQCLACVEGPKAVRDCAIIDCPIWPYRMGHNPHNPQRGRNPFAKPGESVGENGARAPAEPPVSTDLTLAEAPEATPVPSGLSVWVNTRASAAPVASRWDVRLGRDEALPANQLRAKHPMNGKGS